MKVCTLGSRLLLVGALVLLLAACAPAPPSPTAAPAKPAAPPAAAAPTGQPAAAPAAKPAAPAAGQPKYGGILRYAPFSDPLTLDGNVYSGLASDELYGMVYNRLVRFKPDWGGVNPDLAESWDIKDDRIYTFKLRSGVKFHDGSTLTADDVKFTFDRIMDPKTGAYIQPLIASSFGSAEVVDPLTVRITLKQVNAAFLAAIAMPTASIVSKKFVEGGGDLSKTMMGTGPFKFASRQPNVETKVVKNPDYFEKGKPYLDGITIVPLPDETARSTALRNGSVDMISTIPWKDMAAIKADPKLWVKGDAESSGIFMFFKTTKAPLNNAKVRQAINYAVDRNAVLKAAFFGHGAVMNDILLPKGHWAYAKDLPGAYSYDPAKAKQLLAESGIPAPVKFVITTTNEFPMHKTGAEVVQANLRDVGVDATLDVVDWPTDLKRWGSGEYELIMWGGGPLYGEVDYLSAYFRSGNTIPKNSGYSNPQLDKLLDDARATLDQNKRKEFYRQAYEIILADAPWIPLVFREQSEAGASYVKGYENRVLGSNWNGNNLAMIWMDK